jgi:hypothetical protein
MSLCSPCTRLKNVALCTDTIVIGTVAAVSTLHNIYFRSLSNDMIVKYTATSSGAGLLTLTPTDGFILAGNTLYELWVNTSNSSQTGLSLTIGGTAATCYTVAFDRVNDTTYTTQTLERA